jgi:hypothetical protein
MDEATRQRLVDTIKKLESALRVIASPPEDMDAVVMSRIAALTLDRVHGYEPGDGPLYKAVAPEGR